MIQEKSNIFKLNSSEDLVSFIFNVESDNSDKISKLVRDNVDVFFEIYQILNNLQDVIQNNSDIDSEDVSEFILDVKGDILELHNKLLQVDQQYEDIVESLKQVFNDKEMMLNCIRVNKEMIL